LLTVRRRTAGRQTADKSQSVQGRVLIPALDGKAVKPMFRCFLALPDRVGMGTCPYNNRHFKILGLFPKIFRFFSSVFIFFVVAFFRFFASFRVFPLSKNLFRSNFSHKNGGQKC